MKRDPRSRFDQNQGSNTERCGCASCRKARPEREREVKRDRDRLRALFNLVPDAELFT